MNNLTIIGLDLALSSTGIAISHNAEPPITSTFTTKAKTNRYQRLTLIRDHIATITAKADIIVIEDQPTHTTSQSTKIHLAELHGVVGVMLNENKRPVARVNVSTLKRYALGKGIGKKSDLALAAYKLFGIEFTSDDECDAYFLCLMGLTYAGFPAITKKGTPLPQAHLAAIAKVEWPLLMNQP